MGSSQWNETTCSYCGKKFLVCSDAWAYRDEWQKKKLVCCSWSCLRKMRMAIWGNPNGFIVDYDAIVEQTKESKRKRAKRKRAEHGRVGENH